VRKVALKLAYIGTDYYGFEKKAFNSLILDK